MLQAYFQKTSRPRCGLFGRALSRVIDRATFCLFCPAAGTMAEASTTRISLFSLKVKRHCGQQVEWISAPTFSVFRNSS
jgi:hypothetical protein